jgi:chromosome segregation ATPase
MAANQSLLAYAAFIASAITVAVNVWQFLRKRKQENNELANLAHRATAERDSFVVKGAEGALLMMEKMLNTATTEAEVLRNRISSLEEEKKNLTQRVEQLEREKRDMLERISELERKEREHGSGS